jgi:hypothetical protein
MNISYTRSIAGLKTLAIVFFALNILPATAIADDTGGMKPVQADSHAPIGVMGEHMHKKGEWMLSFRYMHMGMEGNKINTASVTPDFIVSYIPNRFAPPPNLRIVPTEMTMDMAMLGVMYAPSDWATLMLMGNYVDKKMDHVTYAMMPLVNPAPIGNFTTEASGLGDTYLGAMLRLYESPGNKIHFNFGVTAPTGSTTKTDQILAPNSMTPTVRLPYMMQLGSGTWDVKPGITYNGRASDFTWGAQYMGTFRVDENNGWNLGDAHDVTGWTSWSPRAWVSGSLRLAYEIKDRIEGIDPNISGPVQTADPNNYGGKWFMGYFGLNFAGQSGWIRGHRLALEAGWPISQDLNGPQMETDFRLTAGWQYAF